MKRLFIMALSFGALLFSPINMEKAHADDGALLGTIIGAVGGGVIGSNIGKGNGRLVATAAGTLIGAAVGQELARAQSYERRVVYDRPYSPHEAPSVRIYTEPKHVYLKRAYPHKKHGYSKYNAHQNAHKHAYKYNPTPKWKETARYGDDVLICHQNTNYCQWRN